MTDRLLAGPAPPNSLSVRKRPCTDTRQPSRLFSHSNTKDNVTISASTGMMSKHSRGPLPACSWTSQWHQCRCATAIIKECNKQSSVRSASNASTAWKTWQYTASLLVASTTATALARHIHIKTAQLRRHISLCYHVTGTAVFWSWPSHMCSCNRVYTACCHIGMHQSIVLFSQRQLTTSGKEG